jgi:hypothetical protein
MSGPMKALISLLAFAAAATPALATETLIPFTDANTYFPPALGKQVDVRFSDSFVKAHLAKADFDAVVVSELPDGKVCFFGRDQGLDPDDAKLKDVARANDGDICVDRADVAVRVVAQQVDGAPPAPFYATDKKGCSWTWLKGKDIGMWTESCKFDSGVWTVAYDEKNNLFTLNVEGSDPFPVLREFRKKPDENPDALLPELRKAKLIPDDEECRFQPSADNHGPQGWSLWEIVPVGKKKEAFDALPDDEVPEPPCGDVGMAVDYVGFFMIPDAHPDRVIHVDLGQDGTMFDPFTVTFF